MSTAARRILSLLGIALGVGLYPGLLPAQTPVSTEVQRGTELEEVVVTARKRNETFQAVPIAMNVFTPETIQSAGIETRAISSRWCRT